MCGIAGILNDDFQQPASPEVLRNMLDRILHRGPDDDGTLIRSGLAMGMRRLSIIDLAGGKQPMFDESERYGIVFNGEIYNYRELRQDLITRGHHLKTHSDTEVIVHLYEEQGVEALQSLRGMFGIAIWDAEQRELFIARDRLGIKPIYYIHQQGSFVFGSEIKSLLCHPKVAADLDVQALGDYLSLKYVPAPRTMFAGIQSLPPGHYLRIHEGKLTQHQYWDVSFAREREPRSEADCVDELKSLLRESVRLRLRSDVPFGAFLSGGLDSSTIVGLMSQELTEPVKTFSVGFQEGVDQDELPYAREVAKRFGCDHHEIHVTAKDFVDQAERVIWHLDQPIADQATMATYMVSQLASQHVKMVLTGEGGDELFAGYARYAGERYSPWLKYLPNSVGGLLRATLPKLPGLRRQKIALYALTLRDETRRFTNWFPLFNDSVREQVLAPSLRNRVGNATRPFADALAKCDAQLPLNRMLYVDSKLWLPDYLLLRGDKLTMAHSLEGRVPLLDHKLVEFAATLPPDLKLHQGTRKYLLKRAAAELLPEGIIHRKKQGFPIPIGSWMRKEARPLIHDLLAPDTIRRRGLFNESFVSRLLQEHDRGFADHAVLLWGLASVELWQRTFLPGN